MKHLFVPYELALKLKEKGFNEPCLTYYYPDKELSDVFRGGVLNSKCADVHVAAPTHQQAVDWFREKHGLHIEVWFDSTQTDGFPYTYQIYKGSEEFNKGTFLETYYDALNEAIEHALELI